MFTVVQDGTVVCSTHNRLEDLLRGLKAELGRTGRFTVCPHRLWAKPGVVAGGDAEAVRQVLAHPDSFEAEVT